MELATIIGLITATGFVLYAIGGNIGAFIEINSIAIVLGGTIGATFVRYPLKVIGSVFQVLMKTIMVKVESPEEMIRKIISLSVEAKKNGILGLEKVKIDNPFLKKGVQLAIDGVEPELIEAVLKIDISATSQRHQNGSGFFTAAGDTAPAFGMIGTLIGLVLMLQNMDDPKAIGPSMAVALLTTLYGSLIANIYCLPLADKLTYYHDEEMLIKQLIVNGILSIANGDHPAVVQEKLASFLKPELRKTLEGASKSGR